MNERQTRVATNSPSPSEFQTRLGKRSWGIFEETAVDGVSVGSLAKDFFESMDLNTGSHQGPYPSVPVK